jgi:glycosyltransferase involved in cell wall biosynthesis
VHNAEPHEGSPRAWRPLARLGYRGDDLCLTHAGSEADKLRSLGVVSEIRTVRHPAPSSLASRADPEAARRTLGIAPDEVVFLFFGYVREYKGVDVLLDALGRLGEHGPPWRALIAGEWYIDRAAADAAIARPPLAGRVRLLDRYVSNEELATLFAAATVVVLPYRAGTQSGVVPLSYAHGRGVITTRVGGLAEAVVDGETGVLVPPEDALRLAEALEGVRAGLRFAPQALAAAHAAGAWAEFVGALERVAKGRPRAEKRSAEA